MAEVAARVRALYSRREGVVMGHDALGAPHCMHIGMFLARSCAPLGAYRAREARCRRDGADGAGDVPLSVALGHCRSLALCGLIIAHFLKFKHRSP